MTPEEIKALEELLLHLVGEMRLLRELVKSRKIPTPIFFDPNKLELAMHANFVECELYPCSGCSAHQHRLCTQWLWKRFRKYRTKREAGKDFIDRGQPISQYGLESRALIQDCLIALQGGYGHEPDPERETKGDADDTQTPPKT